jgi:hypothetical protein
MLTYEEKIAIIETFPELTRKDVSLGRTNYQFEESATDKKNVVYHLHPNGNGFIYAEFVKGYRTNDKGMINIRDFSADQLKDLIEKSIISLTAKEVEENASQEVDEETWVNKEGQTLKLVFEDDMWNIYADLSLDGTFNSYGEAAEYLDEEGFSFKE